MGVESADDVERSHMKRWKGHRIAGILLSAIGFFWLAKRTGWMGHETYWMPHEAIGSPIFWPLVVIAVGLLVLFGLGRRQKKHSE